MNFSKILSNHKHKSKLSLNSILAMIAFMFLVFIATGCSEGKSSNKQKPLDLNSVNAIIKPNDIVKAVINGEPVAVEISFVTAKQSFIAKDFKAKVNQPTSSWKGSKNFDITKEFTCVQVDTSNTCTMSLLYKPESNDANKEKKLNISFSYIKDGTSRENKTIDVRYIAEQSNHVNPKMTDPKVQIAAGGSKEIKISFSTDKGIATDFKAQINHDELAKKYWTVKSGGTCASISVNPTCEIVLAINPPLDAKIDAPDFLVMPFSYKDDQGRLLSQAVRIDFSFLPPEENTINASLDPAKIEATWPIKEGEKIDSHELKISFKADKTKVKTLFVNLNDIKDSDWSHGYDSDQFSCQEVDATDNSCVMHLTFTPDHPTDDGILDLKFSYISANGKEKSGNVSVQYTTQVGNDIDEIQDINIDAQKKDGAISHFIALKSNYHSSNIKLSNATITDSKGLLTIASTEDCDSFTNEKSCKIKLSLNTKNEELDGKATILLKYKNDKDNELTKNINIKYNISDVVLDFQNSFELTATKNATAATKQVNFYVKSSRPNSKLYNLKINFANLPTYLVVTSDKIKDNQLECSEILDEKSTDSKNACSVSLTFSPKKGGVQDSPKFNIDYSTDPNNRDKRRGELGFTTKSFHSNTLDFTQIANKYVYDESQSEVSEIGKFSTKDGDEGAVITAVKIDISALKNDDTVGCGFNIGDNKDIIEVKDITKDTPYTMKLKYNYYANGSPCAINIGKRNKKISLSYMDADKKVQKANIDFQYNVYEAANFTAKLVKLDGTALKEVTAIPFSSIAKDKYFIQLKPTFKTAGHTVSIDNIQTTIENQNGLFVDPRGQNCKNIDKTTTSCLFEVYSQDYNGGRTRPNPIAHKQITKINNIKVAYKIDQDTTQLTDEIKDTQIASSNYEWQTISTIVDQNMAGHASFLSFYPCGQDNLCISAVIDTKREGVTDKKLFYTPINNPDVKFSDVYINDVYASVVYINNKQQLCYVDQGEHLNCGDFIFIDNIFRNNMRNNLSYTSSQNTPYLGYINNNGKKREAIFNTDIKFESKGQNGISITTYNGVMYGFYDNQDGQLCIYDNSSQASTCGSKSDLTAPRLSCNTKQCLLMSNKEQHYIFDLQNKKITEFSARTTTNHRQPATFTSPKTGIIYYSESSNLQSFAVKTINNNLELLVMTKGVVNAATYNSTALYIDDNDVKYFAYAAASGNETHVLKMVAKN